MVSESISLASFCMGRNFQIITSGLISFPRFSHLQNHNLKLALLGGTKSIIVRVVEVINRTWPQHQVVFSHHGYFTGRDDKSIAQAIAATRCKLY